MASRTLKFGSNIFAFALVVFGIVALINFLSVRRFVRVDMTEDKRYTISDSTKKVLKRLDDLVTINAYFSTEPARVAQIRRDIRDVLEEYRAFSKNLQIDFINPAKDDETEKQKLRFMGIPEVQVNVIEKDKAEVANVYLGIAVLYEDKKEVLPVVQNTANLEYDLTSAIIKVTSQEIKTIGFLSGHDELDIDNQQLGQLRQQMQQQYNVRKVEIDPNTGIPQDVSTLVVAGPKKQLTEREKYEIDQFVMQGGRIIFLLDPIQIREGSLQATPLTTGLNDMLEHYGVKLGNNLVLDVSHGQLTYSQGFFQVTTGYPYFPKVLKQYNYRTGETSDGLSKDHIITSQLESLTFPWTSSLEIVSKEGDDAVERIALATTSNDAWTVRSPYDLNPTGRFTPPSSSRSSYALAASLSGVFKSFYADKEIPPAKSEGSEGEDASDDNRTTKTESEPTQIIVAGSSEFLRHGRGTELTFFFNTVDWLSLGEDLISIRSHSITDRPLKEASESEKGLIRFVCIFGIPLLVIAFGLIRYFLRRRAKRLVEAYATN